jgi:ribosomal-protein-alanine N-acetyltransferase
VTGTVTILETERLRLRPLDPGDADALAAVLSDPTTMHWYPHPFSREEVESWIGRNRTHWDERRLGLWGLELKETGELVGDCGPVPQRVEGVDEIELGWHVRRDLWGQGLAPEAGAACRDLCLGERGITRLISLVRPENTQSGRVAEKIGMTVEFETMWANLRHFVYSLGTSRP